MAKKRPVTRRQKAALKLGRPLGGRACMAAMSADERKAKAAQAGRAWWRGLTQAQRLKRLSLLAESRRLAYRRRGQRWLLRQPAA
jgi:hypothetical protein